VLDPKRPIREADGRRSPLMGQERTYAVQKKRGRLLQQKRPLPDTSSVISSLPMATRFCDLAGLLDEKLRDRVERAILEGGNSGWHAGKR
jgi:hypothetical protein